MSQPLTYAMDHVHLFCTDIAATERWLVDGLGAELVRRRVKDGITHGVDTLLGGVRVLARLENPGERLGPAGPSRFGTDHFGLRVENLEATVRELKRRGIEFEAEPRETAPGLFIAFAKGPDSVRVELLQKSQ